MPFPDSGPALLSYRKQQLLVEFSSLRYAPLDGVFVSITPGEPSLWVGVIFVRKGPYSPAVLRFQISFPATYPMLPPLVTFSTDVFHPLLTPLTTYTYTTGSSDNDTVSATDEERLPPGGFSLRHGFPQWFGRARKSAASSRNVSGSGAGSPTPSHTPLPVDSLKAAGASMESEAAAAATPVKDVTIVKVLEYIRSTFSDDAILDSIPLDAAANSGAYHAWRTYRADILQSQLPPPSPNSTASDSQRGVSAKAPEGSTLGRNRRPGEWNWEGVWEERVRKAVKASISEPVLFGGGTAGEDIIRFRNGDEDSLAHMKTQLESVALKALDT
ncbi:hypothetical protein BU24DRAFT_416497 [Aaosphaeria arxii CBS 175.79]|uniref:UBC core domain-containing protein n=1 Tax=Aaosphaeria arxii CBS 175.79 TaxID=1450172 RepID=A0A6A5Y6I9_9PLEO|nr:uncharacterized protein BU24DRAFT_416497 [Aaosphaeria arxii CBS 175.79]KAF2020823.1 hypothetical protein BU24DRAFT_416497 [Aaosphaeria arxii CBS 175.79]